MANLATTAFLNQLKSLYPLREKVGGLHNPWYIVAAVAFSASNRPEAVPSIFAHVLQELSQKALSPHQAQQERLLLARKLRDSLFKSGLTSGYPRAINSLMALHEAMPKELQDTKPMRNTKASMDEHERIGEGLFRSLYGETAGPVQALLNQIYPDMGWFTRAVGYGLTYGFTSVLSPIETSYTLVAALIVGDTPRQITWHLDGARRAGASLEEVKAVRSIAMEVASHSGVQRREIVPEVKDSELL